MALLTLKNASLAFGGPPLLEGADLAVERGERICLIGRNGAGKSTLLKLIHGELTADSGLVARQTGLRTALLPQEVPLGISGAVYDIVASGQPHCAGLLNEYHRLSSVLAKGDNGSLEELEDIQHRLEAAGAWQLHQRIRTVISRIGLEEEAPCETLSAGLKRRVYLARALVSDPDILLLDEPTNHLDIDSILWMEEFLLRSMKTMLFVTHDRTFLSRLATRIVELDRACLTSFPGDYDIYLTRKEEMLEREETFNREFDKKVKREEIWLRQGIKARRTRNEGRVRALLSMRSEVEKRRARSGTVRLMAQEAERSGRLVIAARNISFSYGENIIVNNFTTTILRADKVGIIGPNGCGKTTLLRILAGDLEPDKGSIRRGSGIEAAYFDQLRAQLDDGKTLIENVSEGGDTVFVNGKSRHTIAYLQDFLFTAAQARSPVAALSGGERNRLLLAKLFTRPSNVLVLDEPTNDLDPETLELLEAMLIEYSGTVLIVSHDRTFLNNVAASTLVFEGPGLVKEYVGGYDDWIRQRPAEEKAEPLREPKKGKPKSVHAGPRRLTFKEKRELESLPDSIEKLESEKRFIFEKMADPAFYKNSGSRVGELNERLEALEEELAAAYSRWELLEELAQEA
ncbi:MAG: ATP-binding cassette domain-containing protein [Syntrophales bacterium]|jgi:ATP-binding cassette subfamily F protein uup|nr:ATP-binding cassette domain-containing protein [Syntrophales bacterium]MDY0043031.1 ATP-binding cassette domain-containing protein [Syntrophales bacterium]